MFILKKFEFSFLNSKSLTFDATYILFYEIVEITFLALENNNGISISYFSRIKIVFCKLSI